MSEKPEEPNKITRRELLGYTSGAGLTTASGCLQWRRERAPQLRQEVENTEGELRTTLSERAYWFNYDWNSLELELYEIGPTSVQDAYEFGLHTEIDLASDSDDLFGWMDNEQRRREFFSVFADSGRDILRESYDNLRNYTAPDRPRHRDRIGEYRIRVNGAKCSYFEHSLPGERIGNVTSTTDSYRDFLDEEDITVVLDEGSPFGLGWFC